MCRLRMQQVRRARGAAGGSAGGWRPGKVLCSRDDRGHIGYCNATLPSLLSYANPDFPNIVHNRGPRRYRAY